MILTLDTHVQELRGQYRALLPVYEQMAAVIPEKLKEFHT